MSNSESQILVKTLKAKQGSIGHLRLNSPKALNSINLAMIKQLKDQLIAWNEDDAIACIVLDGEGEKAFCAGGDVQALYQSATETPGGPCEYAEEFFIEEYELDYMIHTYPKPIVCIGSGIVMGGGLGLMAGASHRVVSNSTRIAMPEISIGLIPDVGGTRFLSDMPYGLGIFFALTGASINATDALFLNIADHYIDKESLDKIIESLCSAKWAKTADNNHKTVSELLADLSLSPSDAAHATPSEIAPCMGLLECICRAGALGDIANALNAVSHDSAWLAKAIQNYNNGSPLSALLSFEQLRRNRYASLKEAFESELVLATNIMRYPEFAEGVRALLIDKDKDPQWQFDHFSHVPASLMEAFFTPPWETNPISEKLA